MMTYFGDGTAAADDDDWISTVLFTIQKNERKCAG